MARAFTNRKLTIMDSVVSVERTLMPERANVFFSVRIIDGRLSHLHSNQGRL